MICKAQRKTSQVLRGCFLLHLGGEFLERAERACGNLYATTVDLDGLQVNVLAALGGAVGVAAGLSKVGLLAREETDAGHTWGLRMGIG